MPIRSFRFWACYSALIIVATLWAGEEDKSLKFKPYLFARPDVQSPLHPAKIAIGFQYKNPSHAPEVVSFDVGTVKNYITVPVNNREGLSYVDLPFLPTENKPTFFRLRADDSPRALPNLDFSHELSFWFFSDMHYRGNHDNRIHEAMVAQLSNLRAPLVLNGGDCLDKSLANHHDHWKGYLDLLSPVSALSVLLTTAGNHDYRSSPAGWNRMIGAELDESFYNLRLGQVQFIVLNTNFKHSQTSLLEKEKEWLNRLVLEPTAPFTVVLGHHPPFGTKKLIKGQTTIKENANGVIYARELLPILQKLKSQLILLGGHIHYHQLRQDDCGYLVTAGAANGAMSTVEQFTENQGAIYENADATLSHFRFFGESQFELQTTDVFGRRLHQFRHAP